MATSARANPPDRISASVTSGKVCTLEARIITSIIGKMTKAPSCWAALMSFTLVDMITLASTLKTHTKGVTTPITIAQYTFGTRNSLRFVIDQASTMITKIRARM